MPNMDTQASLAPIILLILAALAFAGSFFLLADSDFFAGSPLRTAVIVVIAATVAAVFFLVVWEFSAANRLRRALKKMAPLIDSEPSEAVKNSYLQIYNLYLKLSEKRKRNFYTRVNSLRERIEEHLKNEKEIERLFQEADKGGIAEQKKTYLKMYKAYEKLPQKVQHQYYPRIVQLRDRLERGN